MTVSSSEITQNSYVANGVLVQFEIRFKWYQANDVVVSLDGVVQSTGFSIVIDPNTDPDASNDSDVVSYVVFDTAPASAAVVLIEQNIQITQETDYLTFGKFPADSHEKALDKLTLLIRQLNEVTSKDRGTFLSFGALPNDGGPGDYAYVDVVGSDIVKYIWDDTDSIWVAVSGSSGGGNISQFVNDSGYITDSDVPNNSQVQANSAKRTYPVSDENKLSNIETGATRDQTATEIEALLSAIFRSGWNAATEIVTTSPAHPSYGSINNVVDGVNTVFDIHPFALESTIMVYYRGQLQTDWTYNSGQITMGFAPKTGTGNEIVIKYEQVIIT